MTTPQRQQSPVDTLIDRMSAKLGQRETRIEFLSIQLENAQEQIRELREQLEAREAPMEADEAED